MVPGFVRDIIFSYFLSQRSTSTQACLLPDTIDTTPENQMAFVVDKQILDASFEQMR